ncbi:hypothetical protein [Lentibacillus sp. CBA3610]|uniref:hypothetical protein n=1 Tax=Lentibacillus sp. CBA3610 TaxID=2518176 RepID=UPI00350E3637
MNKKQRARNWGRVLFFEDLPWTSFSIAHFDTFIKVDTFYYTTKDIQPSIWLQNIKVVHDPAGFVNEVKQQSLNLSYFPSVQEVELWRANFFANFHEAYRRIMREEIYYALHCLDNLRMSMAIAWYMKSEIQPNTFGDWAKIEGKRSELKDWQLSLLAQWHSSRDPNEILNVIKEIVPEFKKVHKYLCEKVEIEEQPQWVEEILKMVL